MAYIQMGSVEEAISALVVCEIIANYLCIYVVRHCRISTTFM